MGLFLTCLTLGLAAQLWLTWRVSRSSVPLAVATFFVGPLGAAYTAVKQRDDPDTRVTLPFILCTVFTLLTLYTGWSLLQRASLERAAQASAQAAAEAASAVTADAAVPAADVLASFSNALREAGLPNTPQRLDAATQLPRGTIEGMRFSVDMPPAPDAPAFNATLLRCADAPACRALAGAFVNQKDRPRVLQNGALLLVIPSELTTDPAGLHNTVAGVFRRFGR